MKGGRIVAWSLGSLMLLLLLAAAGLYWASRSEQVLRWGVARVAQQLPCSLSVTGLHGAFIEPIDIQRLVCENNDYRIEADNLSLVWAPWLLLQRQLSIDSVHIEALTYLSKSQAADPLAAPQELVSPIAVDLGAAVVDTLSIRSGELDLVLTGLDAAYRSDARTHNLTVNKLNSEWGSLSGDAAIGTLAPLPVNATLKLSSERIENWPLVAEVMISGELQRLSALIDAAAAQVRVDAKVELAPFDEEPIKSITARVTEFDATTLDARLPQTSATVTVQAVPVSPASLSGTLQVDNTIAGTLDQNRLPLQHLDAEFVLDANSLRLPALRLDLGPAGTAEGSAELTTAQIALLLQVRELDLQALRSDLRPTSLNGLIRVEQREQLRRVAVKLDQQGLLVEGDAEISQQLARFQRVTIRAGDAKAQASGQIELSQPHHFNIDGTLVGFDPARFGRFPQANINGSLQAEGTLHPQWDASVQYRMQSSQLAGVPLGGSGRFRISPTHVDEADARIDYGGNHLHLTGSFGSRGDQLQFALDATRLDRLDAAAAGRIQARGTISGSLEHPALSADLSGSDLAYRDIRLEQAKVQIAIEGGADAPLGASARLEGVRHGDAPPATITASIDGTLAAHRAEMTLAAPGWALSSQLQGGWNKAQRAWSGRLDKLENSGDFAFRMTRDTKLELAPQHIVIGPTDISSQHAQVHLGETRFGDQGLVTQGTVTGVRASRLLSLLQQPMAIEPTLVLEGRWEIRANETVDGLIELSRSSGDVVIAGEQALPLDLQALSISLRAAANALNIEAQLRSARISAHGSAQTRLEKRDGTWGIAGTAPLKLSAELEMQSVRPLAALASRAVTADGSLKLNVAGSGTLAAPKLSGSVEGDNLRIESVANGVFFGDGILRASFSDDTLVLSQLRLHAGDGAFNAHGRFARREGAPLMSLDWDADKVALIQHPSLRLTVSGGGQLALDGTLISLKGKLVADQGRVELRSRAAPSLGSDVVVAGEDTEAQSAAPERRANLDLELDLGPEFTVSGRGLNARVNGRIHLASTSDKALAADGKIVVSSGTFEAYGRLLNIETGELYFAGPVDNPGLNIRAMRKNQPVEAGVEITGTAKDPRIHLVSDPEVPDPEKLSWLVLGRQAEAANMKDNQTLQNSALALAAGLGSTPLQRQLAQAVGVDEITFVPASGGSEGGVVAIGKQISDKIYVTQELGSSAAGNTLRVSYQLSRRWSLRTESGKTDAVDLFFTFSFD